MPDVEHLDPSKLLVDEAADWLSRRARKTAEGAASLEHVLVLAPTAQSARALSLALARRFEGRGLIAPEIARESDLLDSPPPGFALASATEETGALAGAILEDGVSRYKALFPRGGDMRDGGATPQWAVGAAAAIREAQDVLSGNALAVEDALAAAADESAPEALAADRARWEDVAAICAKAEKTLARHGLATRAEARRRAAAAGCAIEGIEEIVLPAAAGLSGAMCKYLEASRRRVVVLLHAAKEDAGKFDKWGRPREMFAARLRPRDIRSFAGVGEEARAVAAFFAGIDGRDALPALVACDCEAFPELEGAFGERFAGGSPALSNPAPWPFARSSLGRLFSSLRQYAASDGSYRAFSSLVRSGDVARWAAKETGMSPAEVAEAVGTLDELQNSRLPRTAADVISILEESLADGREPAGARVRALRKARKACLGIARAVDANARDPAAFLRKIFEGIALDPANRAHRELAAAAAVLRQAREECESPAVPPRVRDALLAAALDRASYQLEPDSRHVLRTGGWIEAQWKGETEIVFSGFAEGCVPETTASHAFVPESLRRLLGLETNEMRAMRDSFLLAEAVASRPAGAARVFFHNIASDGSPLKPSRILFEGISDGELGPLATRLFATGDATDDRRRRGSAECGGETLPRTWRLKLPFPPRERTWPETISPSAIDRYMRCPFEYWLHETFGEHSDDKAAELDARGFGTMCHAALDAFARSSAADSADESEIAAFLRNAVWSLVCGGEGGATAVAMLQARAAIARLDAFARIQAERRRAGWRIARSELAFARGGTVRGVPTRIRGVIDRIDEHESTGELAIIDYKTWDEKKDEKDFASLQLPLYRMMLQTSGLFPADKARDAKAFYCILAKNAEDTAFDIDNACGAGGQSAAEEEARRAIEAVADGIFWPPAKKSRWKDGYGSIVWKTPEDGVDEEWIADQKARIAEREAGK